MGLFNFLFGKSSNVEAQPAPEPEQAPKPVRAPIVREIPEGAYTEPSLAIKGLIRYANLFLSDDEELYGSHLDTTYHNHPNLLKTPNIPEVRRVYDIARKTYRAEKDARTNDTTPHEYSQYVAWRYNLYEELRQALRDFLEAVPYLWYENEIQARLFYVTGTFKFGTQAEVIERLKELGGEYSKWGASYYCDMLVVGSKTKPELIEKRQRELDEYNVGARNIKLVMEDDLPSLWSD